MAHGHTERSGRSCAKEPCLAFFTLTFPNLETWSLHSQVLISVVNILPLTSGAVVQRGLD